MRICFNTDQHWSEYASILRSRGEKYSTRLEGLIKSLNWVEETAVKLGCDVIVNGGDYFDSPNLNAPELSALDEIKWSDLSHVMLVGNHEMGRNNLEISSAHLFNLVPNCKVMDTPCVYPISNHTRIAFLPYILECNREPLETYFGHFDGDTIIFSHNDIKDVQMGMIISKEGFALEDILKNCRYFINGHLHSGMWVERDRILNLGNLTGQNFSEDASKYSHNIFILDTEDYSKNQLIENPYAFNFYKLDVTTNKDFNFDNLKNNAVCTVKCREEDVAAVREAIANCSKIIESRVVIEREIISSTSEDGTTELNNIDHLQKFVEFVHSTVGTSTIIEEELGKVLV